jgi:hypothetical protein
MSRMTPRLRASTFKVLSNSEWLRYQKIIQDQEKLQKNEMEKAKKIFDRFSK